MDAVADLRLLLQSGTSVIAVDTSEEHRCLSIVRAASTGAPVWTWSAATGLGREGSQPLYGTVDPDQMLSNLTAMSGTWTAVLLDPTPLLGDPASLRALKELGQRGQNGQSVLLVGHRLTIPTDLEGLVHRWRLGPPSVPELDAMIQRASARLGQQNVAIDLDDQERVRLARSLLGLTLVEAERQVMQAGLRNGRLDDADIALALAGKAELLNADGILEIVDEPSLRLAELGGLDHLKQWLGHRVAAGLDRAVDPPRGVLLAGIPGCGKSALAHAIAAEWSIPLVLLDPGRIYSKYIGESEQRFEAALTTVEAMAPAVLWIDEIEKGFTTGGEDGGVSSRVLGTFLRWLQDHAPGVFVVATANDVTRLPAELTRKGRFDELFFVDLPDVSARAAIARAQLAQRSITLSDADLATIADTSDGFSGAEIEAAIAAASYSGAITLESVTTELHATVPLSRSRTEEIRALREWATHHARAA